MKEKAKLSLITGAIVVLVVLSISFVVAAKNSGNSGQDLQETTLQVSNLSCGSCLATINGELRQYEGMAGLDADLAKGIVVVSHTEELSPQKIAATISDLGYPAKVIVSQASGGRAFEGVGSRGAAGGCGGCGSSGCALPAPQPAPEKG